MRPGTKSAERGREIERASVCLCLCISHIDLVFDPVHTAHQSGSEMKSIFFFLPFPPWLMAAKSNLFGTLSLTPIAKQWCRHNYEVEISS